MSEDEKTEYLLMRPEKRYKKIPEVYVRQRWQDLRKSAHQKYYQAHLVGNIPYKYKFFPIQNNDYSPNIREESQTLSPQPSLGDEEQDVFDLSYYCASPFSCTDEAACQYWQMD